MIRNRLELTGMDWNGPAPTGLPELNRNDSHGIGLAWIGMDWNVRDMLGSDLAQLLGYGKSY